VRFNVDQLRDALKLLKPVTRSNRRYEPWRRVLVSYDGNFESTISATNGDVWMVAHISANAESEPITLFLDLVELEEAIKWMDFNVYLTKSETDDEVVLVSDSVGKRSTLITNYLADDFAPVPEAKPDCTSGLLFQFTQRNWTALRERVMPYAAQDDCRPVLACVHLENQFGNVFATAADGFRLANDHLTDAVQEFDPFLLPVPHLKMLPSKPVSVSVYSMGAESEYVQLEFSHQRTKKSRTQFVSMVVRTLDGTYPDYHQIIPKPETLNGGCTVPVWIVEEAAKAKDGNAFRLSPGKAELTLVNRNNSTATQTMNWVNPGVTFHGELEQLAINPQYLNTAAQQIKIGNMVTIKTTATRGGHCFISDGVGQVVIMPMELPPDTNVADADASAEEVAAD